MAENIGTREPAWEENYKNSGTSTIKVSQGQQLKNQGLGRNPDLHIQVSRRGLHKGENKWTRTRHSIMTTRNCGKIRKRGREKKSYKIVELQQLKFRKDDT